MSTTNKNEYKSSSLQRAITIVYMHLISFVTIESMYVTCYLTKLGNIHVVQKVCS
jgi:hypothetical protein